jgi:folate-dependent phosphoribosylglycinamide formyltransferase PurN
MSEEAGVAAARPRTLLICHHDDPLTRESMERWLASFTDLAGIVVIEEPTSRVRRRIRRELERVGALRFLDVLAWRAYARLVLGARDRAWEAAALERVRQRFPAAPAATPVFHTQSPNTEATQAFIERQRPDFAIARCKTLLRKSVFSVPPHGTWVMHPGICPEYRNAHGCFWALARGDHERVGMTLLKIDDGVDTGPVYGYYSYEIDEAAETPAMINHEVVLANLDTLRETFLAIHAGTARPIDTRGRASGVWGQPWLSRYLRWKWRARRRK